MQRRVMGVRELERLESRAKPYAVAIGIPGVRLHVAVSGSKVFQLRVNGSMRTLGKLGELTMSRVRALASGVEPLPPNSEPKRVPTLAEWLTRYIEHPRFKDIKTMHKRVPTLRHLLGPILHKEPSALTTEWLNQRCRELLATGGVKRQGSLKLGSIRIYRGYVVALVTFIVAKRGLERSPFVEEKLP